MIKLNQFYLPSHIHGRGLRTQKNVKLGIMHCWYARIVLRMFSGYANKCGDHSCKVNHDLIDECKIIGMYFECRVFFRVSYLICLWGRLLSEYFRTSFSPHSCSKSVHFLGVSFGMLWRIHLFLLSAAISITSTDLSRCRITIVVY